MNFHFYNKQEMTQQVDMLEIKDKIAEGIQMIQKKGGIDEAILMMGDTGVGKSTIMSYLANQDLRVEQRGLKNCLVGSHTNKIKIGHLKYSQTSLPNEVMIDGQVFYDCPGFNDNTSDYKDIINSFYVHRIIELYPKLKFVIVIDYSYLTESRSYRLPALTQKLKQAFGTLSAIQDNVFLIINKCKYDWQEKLMVDAVKKIVNQKSLSSFSSETKRFFEKLMDNQRYYIFREPIKQQTGCIFEKTDIPKILHGISKIGFTQVKMNNVVSEPVKLVIREYLDNCMSEMEQKMVIYEQNLKNKIMGGIQNLQNEDKIKMLEEKRGKILRIMERGKEQMRTMDNLIDLMGKVESELNEKKTMEMEQLQKRIQNMLFLEKLSFTKRNYQKNIWQTYILTIFRVVNSIDSKLSTLIAININNIQNKPSSKSSNSVIKQKRSREKSILRQQKQNNYASPLKNTFGASIKSKTKNKQKNYQPSNIDLSNSFKQVKFQDQIDPVRQRFNDFLQVKKKMFVTQMAMKQLLYQAKSLTNRAKLSLESEF